SCRPLRRRRALAVHRHNDGSACRFTRGRGPVQLVYSEPHADRPAALRRERRLKRWTRAKKEALIAGDLALLKRLRRRDGSAWSGRGLAVDLHPGRERVSWADLEPATCVIAM